MELLLTYIRLVVVFTGIGSIVWYLHPDHWVGTLAFLIGTMIMLLLLLHVFEMQPDHVRAPRKLRRIPASKTFKCCC